MDKKTFTMLAGQALVKMLQVCNGPTFRSKPCLSELKSNVYLDSRFRGNVEKRFRDLS